MDLSLFNRLQGSDTATLILRERRSGILNYYLISQTVSHTVISTGECEGMLDCDSVCFNIRMTSIIPLIERKYKLSIKYTNGDLKFLIEGENAEITPLYVEYKDEKAFKVISKYIDFFGKLNRQQIIEESVTSLEDDIRVEVAKKNTISRMNLTGIPSENPFPDLEDNKENEMDKNIESKRIKIQALLKESPNIPEVDLSDFTDIISAASRNHAIVDFCSDYAITSGKISYLIQKGSCPTMSIAGFLLSILVRDGEGKGFYELDDGLVYLKGEREVTAVFITKYLPNIEVDTSIITRGAVQEKYSVKLKNFLSLASIVRSKFPYFKMDMGDATFILSNDNDETIKYKFSIEDAKTIQLNRILKGETNVGPVTMSVIDVPKEVQGLLGFFRNNLTVYVKSNKIIFQNDNLYLVFGR